MHEEDILLLPSSGTERTGEGQLRTDSSGGEPGELRATPRILQFLKDASKPGRGENHLQRRLSTPSPRPRQVQAPGTLGNVSNKATVQPLGSGLGHHHSGGGLPPTSTPGPQWTF